MSSSACYHRGDPLDIPLIDNHLLTKFLLPRITSAIKLIYPQIYLDWTTGTTATTTSESYVANNDTMLWKRVVEGLLRTCLVLGSCHQYSSYKRRNNKSRSNDNIHVTTPAMHSLGMFIRPSSTSSNNNLDKSKYYNATANRNTKGYNYYNLFHKYHGSIKVLALIIVTVMAPSLYQELKLRRTKQLEENERRLRINEIRREVPSLAGQQIQQPSPSSNTRPSTASIIQHRSQQRKSKFQSLLSDTILGLGDVLLPPIRLITYISYLWGMSNTPNLGMKLCGWEYCSVASPKNNDTNIESGDYDKQVQQQQYQRHANFQYGNRRLLVEEALRTVAVVLPPRSAGTTMDTAGAGTTTTAQTMHAEGHGGNNIGNANLVPRSRYDAIGGGNQPNQQNRGIPRRAGWFRKRALSFMGVVEEEEVETSSDNAANVIASDKKRYTTQTTSSCSLCHMDNPTVPYIASCGHCYCYMCLRMAVTDDIGFCCVDCGRSIASSGRPKLVQS